MNLKEFLENKNKLDTTLSCCTGESDRLFLVAWEKARDCPVHDGFYDDPVLTWTTSTEELLSEISRRLNNSHVRDLVELRISSTKIVEVTPIGVQYEPSGHTYVSISVQGLGKYRDIGNGVKQWVIDHD